LNGSSSPLLLSAALGSALVYSLVAAADTALSSLPSSRLAVLHDQATGQTRARLRRFLGDPSRILGRWLAARVLSSAVASVSTYGLLENFSDVYRPWVAVVAVLLLMSVLSELTTAIARARPAAVGPRLMALLRPVELLVLPVADPLSGLGQVLGQWLTTQPGPDDEPMAEAEVEQFVEEATKAGQLEPEPAEMIRNVLDLKDQIVRDVMVPRIKISAVEVETPLAEVVAIVVREGHSRYPVYAQVVDNVVGLLYARDLLTLLDAGGFEGKTLRDVLHAPVNFVPDTQPVATVLRDMRSRRQHMAILVDEFGGVSGLVTLEDLLERIVGDIRDEYDPEDAPIQDLGNGRLLADASVSLADLSTYLGTEIQGSGDYGSLGGLLMHQAGQVPAVGDSIESSGLTFIVRDGDAKRIIKVEIILPPPSISPPSQQIPVL